MPVFYCALAPGPVQNGNNMSPSRGGWWREREREFLCIRRCTTGAHAACQVSTTLIARLSFSRSLFRALTLSRHFAAFRGDISFSGLILYMYIGMNDNIEIRV